MDHVLIVNFLVFAARMILGFIIVRVCFITFPDSLLLPKRRIYLHTGLLILIYTSLQFIVYEIFYSIDGIFEQEYFSIINSALSLFILILYYLTLFLYFRKIVQIDFYKLIFVFCMAFSFANIPNNIQAYTGILYNNLPVSYELLVIIRNTVYVLICTVSLFTIGWFFRRFISSHLKAAKSGDIRKICIIPILFFIVTWIINEFYYMDLVRESTRGFFIFLVFSITALAVFVYTTIFQMQANANSHAEAEYQLELNRENYKLLSDRYMAIQTHISETKRAQHDLRHHLSVIRAHASARENNKLIIYLNDYIDSLSGNNNIMDDSK